jgi:iron-regulated transporter 1
VSIAFGLIELNLSALNAQMRRIDLFCKLVGPLSVAFIDGVSTMLAICVVFGLNLTSVLIEYFAIAQVSLKSAPLKL